MRIDSAGLPFIGGALALALVSGAAVAWFLAIPFLVLAAFFAFFFRDPRSRRTAGRRRRAVAGRWPRAGGGSGDRGRGAAGRVAAGEHLPVADGRAREPRAGVGPRDARHLHAGAVPAGLSPRCGHDQRAQRDLDRSSGQTVVARQIVGMLARRVVCRVAPGADVRAGDRFGIMKFGSRMDVFLPLTATITVKVGRDGARRRNRHRGATLDEGA